MEDQRKIQWLRDIHKQLSMIHGRLGWIAVWLFFIMWAACNIEVNM